MGLHIHNLSLTTATGTPLFNELSLTLMPGSLTLLTGPNGSGKSSLALTIMGHPGYSITQGTITYYQQDLHTLSPEARARAGIFLAFQHPIEIPGVPLSTLLTESYRAIHGTQLAASAIIEKLYAALERVGLDRSFAERSVHAGASGGERKKMELAQAWVLEPSLIICDEVDSGVDTEGQKLLSQLIGDMRTANPNRIFLVITHNHHFGNSLAPDMVYHLPVHS